MIAPWSVSGLSGSQRVKRGGSFNNDDADNLRAANRNNDVPSNANDNLGFRCASSPDAGGAASTDAARVPRRPSPDAARQHRLDKERTPPPMGGAKPLEPP